MNLTEIDRPHFLQHTWVSEATKGLESIVSVAFRPSVQRQKSLCARGESRTMSWDSATRKGGARFSRSSPIASFPRSRRHRTLNLNSLGEIPCRKRSLSCLHAPFLAPLSC